MGKKRSALRAQLHHQLISQWESASGHSDRRCAQTVSKAVPGSSSGCRPRLSSPVAAAKPSKALHLVATSNVAAVLPKPSKASHLVTALHCQRPLLASPFCYASSLAAPPGHPAFTLPHAVKSDMCGLEASVVAAGESSQRAVVLPAFAAASCQAQFAPDAETPPLSPQQLRAWRLGRWGGGLVFADPASPASLVPPAPSVLECHVADDDATVVSSSTDVQSALSHSLGSASQATAVAAQVPTEPPSPLVPTEIPSPWEVPYPRARPAQASSDMLTEPSSPLVPTEMPSPRGVPVFVARSAQVAADMLTEPSSPLVPTEMPSPRAVRDFAASSAQIAADMPTEPSSPLVPTEMPSPRAVPYVLTLSSQSS